MGVQPTVHGLWCGLWPSLECYLLMASGLACGSLDQWSLICHLFGTCYCMVTYTSSVWNQVLLDLMVLQGLFCRLSIVTGTGFYQLGSVHHFVLKFLYHVCTMMSAVSCHATDQYCGYCGVGITNVLLIGSRSTRCLQSSWPNYDCCQENYLIPQRILFKKRYCKQMKESLGPLPEGRLTMTEQLKDKWMSSSGKQLPSILAQRNGQAEEEWTIP